MVYNHHVETKELVARNVRARLAWHRVQQQTLKSRMGWSQRTLQNKLSAVTALTIDEVVALANLFGLDDPGPLYRVPETFGEISPELSGPPPSTRSSRRHLACVTAADLDLRAA